MRAVSFLPARYEAPTPTALQPANDSYSNVMVGGITTVCLSRDALPPRLEGRKPRKQPARSLCQ